MHIPVLYILASILQIFPPSVCRSGYKRQKCKNIETFISRRLFKIKCDSFCEDSSDQWPSVIYIFFRWSVSHATKGINVRFLETGFYRPLIKIEVWFFCAHSSDIWVSILQKINLTVGLSVRLQKQKETSISLRLFKREVYFFVKIPLINDHLLYEYFFRWSVGRATKGINV